ncbi:MDR family oxidoreductase [Enterobacteriaceae bacterium LUAb1]
MQALLLEQREGKILATVKKVSTSALPAGNVTVDISWSGLNYKDALAITGKGNIIRQFPMIPGIDFAGKISESSDPRFHPGQDVLLTGWGAGEQHWGGLAERARVQGDWLIPIPPAMDARNAMIIGTAGLTAMLCVIALQEAGIKPETGPVLVSGASGGVGCIAVALLHALNYRVTAVSGRRTTHDFLYKLGACEILSREAFTTPGKPLETQRWAGAIDTAGGQLLARVLAQMQYNGAVAACGLAGGVDLPASVLPFILRNVRLLGIDSVNVPVERRRKAWKMIAQILPADFYQNVSNEIPLTDVMMAANKLLNNQLQGRTIVKIGQA